ncbi:hypothetical protein LXL04_037199, partial [Taraxacum kok-saghyz]
MVKILPTSIPTYISTHHGTMTYMSNNFYPHSPVPPQVSLKSHLHLQTQIHNNTLPYSDPFAAPCRRFSPSRRLLLSSSIQSKPTPPPLVGDSIQGYRRRFLPYKQPIS